MLRPHSYIVNGNLNQAISPLDRGFAYGDGVFRTLKIVNGIPAHWPMHYQKLVADCAAIGIVCPSAELFINDFQHLFGLDEVAVAKLMVTRGEGERGYAPPAITLPTRVVIKSDMPTYAKQYYVEGVNLHVCNTRLAPQKALAGIKHLNRLENVLARMEWKDDAIFDGILLDQQGLVIECSMSNIFARFGKVLVTPDLTECGVAGITRQGVLNIAHTLDLTIETTALPLARLLEADEVIVCNSLYGAFQVKSISKTTWAPQALAATIRSILAYD